jgi:hypothetical protein
MTPLALVLFLIGLQQEPGSGRVDTIFNLQTDPALLSPLNGGPEVLGGWLRPKLDALDARYASETRARVLVVQITFHPEAVPDIEIVGKPRPNADEIKEIKALFPAEGSPRTRVMDVVMQYIMRVNLGEAKPDDGWALGLVDPEKARLRTLETLTLAKHHKAIADWARTELLPALEVIASETKKERPAVDKLYTALQGLPADGAVDIAALTDRSVEYWRALVEVPPGDPIVPLFRIGLLAAREDLNLAGQYAALARRFDSGYTASSALLAAYLDQLTSLAKRVSNEVKNGVDLHDAGRFDDALAVYDALIAEAPDSGVAHYERFQTQVAKAAKAGRDLEPVFQTWDEVKRKLDTCDPFFFPMALSTGDEEQFQLLRRGRFAQLFRDPKNRAQDAAESAEIALDLGLYGFAAETAWPLAKTGGVPGRGRDALLGLFFFSLDRLGVHNLDEAGKIDRAAVFRQIEAEQRQRRERLFGPSPGEEAGKPGNRKQP